MQSQMNIKPSQPPGILNSPGYLCSLANVFGANSKHAYVGGNQSGFKFMKADIPRTYRDTLFREYDPFVARETVHSNDNKRRVKLETLKTSQTDCEISVFKITSNATIPLKGSTHAAGFDLYAAHQQLIPANGGALVTTDLAINLPAGTYGRIADRSGLLPNYHLRVVGGVLDRDFRGNVTVSLFNHGQEEFLVFKGQRIAQLIIEKIMEDVKFQ